MSKKLGYTWYPKDFISDPDVMFMTSSQRGVYRDLLDLAYMNDNLIKYNVQMLAKYTNSDEETVQSVVDIKCIKTDKGYSIPSCEKRMNLAEKNRENGKKGGRPKENNNPNKTQTKPKNNPSNNHDVSEDKTQIERQREREREIEIENKSECEIIEKPHTQKFSHYGKQPIETLKKNCATHHSWLTVICKKNSLNFENVLEWLDAFESHLLGSGKIEETESEFKRYFNSWVTSEIRQGRTPKVIPKVTSEQKTHEQIAMDVIRQKYGNIT